MEREQILELRQHVQRFVRLFGLLEQGTTPCGYELSVSQVMALHALEAGPQSVTGLAGMLGLERSTVSRLVDGMVKAGLIHRKENDANRREVLVSLTERGQRAADAVRDQSVRFFRSVLAGWTPEEQQQLVQSFQRLNQSLAAVRGDEA